MEAEQLKQSNRQRVGQISKKTETIMQLADKLDKLADQLEGTKLGAIAEKLDAFQEKLSSMPEQIAGMQSVSDKKLNAWISQVNQALSNIQLNPSFEVAAPNVEVKAPGVDLSPITSLVSGIEKSISSSIGSIKMPEQEDRTDELKEAMGEVRDAINSLIFPVAEFPTTLKVTNTDGSAVGGGIQYTEGDTDASITGNAMMYEGAANALTVPSSTNPLPTSQTYGSADYFPQYNRADLGAGMPNVDPYGSLQIRGPVLTDEGLGRMNFTGSSFTRTIGTATFTTGSLTVTGTGFATTYDLHQGNAVRLSADTDYDWNTVAKVVSDTELLLVSPYTGTGGTGASITAPASLIAGAGGSVSVANGQLTIGTGTTADDASLIFAPVFNGPVIAQASFSVSQRIANQDFVFGYERAPFATIQQFARFRATGTNNQQIICETGYNPTGAPSASETESTTVTIPDGDTTATQLTYKIELQPDRVVFSIGNSLNNLTVVATHSKRIPHIVESYPYGNYVSLRVLNGSTPPASNTNFIFDYAFGRVFNRLDVSQSTPGDESNSQVVSMRDASTSFDTLQNAATGTGNGTALYTDGHATAMFTVTGSGSWTVTFEGTEDGTNWYSLNTNRQGTDTIGSTATNTTLGTYKADVSGFQYVRARVSTFASGSVTVTAHATPMPSTSRIVNANLVAGSATIGSLSTVTTLTNGGVAHDTADSGNPHKIGTKSVATLSTQTLVAANDRSNVFSDLDGAVLIREDATLGDQVNGTASNTDGTSTQVLAAGASGIKHYITDVTLANTSASDIYVELKDGSTAKWVFPVPANGGVTHQFRTPLGGTAATAWNFDPSAAATTVYCSVSGFKSKI